MAPNPYIGQKGPDKNPLLINLLATILAKIVSKLQPIKE
jgi:hypothetical protein